MDAVREHFRPEFLNRVDEIILFHPLGRSDIGRIVDIQLARLVARLAERKIAVDLTEAAKAQLVEEGYDPTYGARPLKRTIQRRVLDPLARKVLEGEFREGDTRAASTPTAARSPSPATTPAGSAGRGAGARR